MSENIRKLKEISGIKYDDKFLVIGQQVDDGLDKIGADLSEIRTAHRLAEREVTRAREAIRKLEEAAKEDGLDIVVHAKAVERLLKGQFDAQLKRIDLNAAEDAFVKLHEELRK